MTENIHMGLVAGTKNFVVYVKKKYTPYILNEEIPQQKKRKEDYEIEKLLKDASSLFGCDLKRFKAAPRISRVDKLNRDILIYMLWKTGIFTNKEIAACFGLGYSAVSRRVSLCNDMVKLNEGFKRGYDVVKSLIKMCPPAPSEVVVGRGL